jgi:DNA polymerase-3 subunit gamma/tau
LSRCLQFNLKRLPPEMIREYLQRVLTQENIAAEAGALKQIARAADGSMRDALSLLDQAIAYGGGRVEEAEVRVMLGTIEQMHVVNLLDALAAGDGAGLLQHIAALNEFSPDYEGALAELLSLLHNIAVAQAVPGAAVDEHLDSETVRRLAAALSPEDVQLFYQIGLAGRRDLAVAPSPRLGFEMSLLRMLAFRPLETSRGAPTVPAAPTKKPAQPEPSTQRAAAPPLKAGGESDRAPVQANDKIAAADDHWHQLIGRLPLQGVVRALANNCALIRREANTFHLALAPVHASLRNSKVEERLQEALSAHLGEKVKLLFTITQPAVETPAALQERVSQDRLRAAQEAITQDSHVKALQEMFGARVVPESVRPLD